MVGHIKDPGEASAGDDALAGFSLSHRLVPTALGLLALKQPAHPLGNRVRAVVAGGQQAQKRPGRLRRSALAHAARIRVVVAVAALAPAAVGVLHRDQPLGRTPERVDGHRLGGAQAAQSERRSVNVVDAPASIPGAVALLIFNQVVDAALYRFVGQREAAAAQRL